jgi:hypothetical protein
MIARSVFSRWLTVGAVWALLCGAQVLAQQTYPVTINKTGAVYSAAKSNSFSAKLGTAVEWKITNATNDPITVRGTGFTCAASGSAPASCPLDWAGCVGEVAIAANSVGTMSGVAQDSGCTPQPAPNQKWLWHNFNFVVVGPDGTAHNVDPRLEIDKGGVVIGPGLIIVGVIVAGVAAYLVYQQLSKQQGQPV